MSIEGIFSLLTHLLSEDFITHVTHHAALPMPPQRDIKITRQNATCDRLELSYLVS